MHEAESRALKRAAILLVLISVLRWGWATRDADVVGEVEGGTVLPELLSASRQAADEEARRSEPLAEGELVDPNRADDVELDRLPGVGPATAEAIIAARDSGSVFRSPEDLLVVRGIGPSTLERIRPSLNLSVPPAASRRLPTGAEIGRPGSAAAGPVDVNTADLDALESLPGIGPALAERIVAARTEQVFTTVDDLVRVRGIGPATLERLRTHVTVGRTP